MKNGDIFDPTDQAWLDMANASMPATDLYRHIMRRTGELEVRVEGYSDVPLVQSEAFFDAKRAKDARLAQIEEARRVKDEAQKRYDELTSDTRWYAGR